MRLSGILGRLHGRLGGPRPLLVLVSLQVAAIAVVGGATVARFHVFASVDERQHFAYVQEVAEHGRLPHLGRDLVSWQIQAINDGTYPRHSPRDPRLIGLAGQSYEAFQPPLYYVVAAPAFLVGGSNYRHKVTAVRAFDLALLLGAVAALALLARAVFAGRWLIPFSLGLSVLSWPGVIVRTVTVSNSALELPLVLLYIYALWQATAHRSGRWLAAAGALFGLCLLPTSCWSPSRRFSRCPRSRSYVGTERAAPSPRWRSRSLFRHCCSRRGSRPTRIATTPSRRAPSPSASRGRTSTRAARSTA